MFLGGRKKCADSHDLCAISHSQHNGNVKKGLRLVEMMSIIMEGLSAYRHSIGASSHLFHSPPKNPPFYLFSVSEFKQTIVNLSSNGNLFCLKLKVKNHLQELHSL